LLPFVPQLPLALQLLLEEQLLLVPHDTLSDFPPSTHCLQVFGAGDAHPVISPAIAATTMTVFVGYFMAPSL
jgi:hypothetical protein